MESTKWRDGGWPDSQYNPHEFYTDPEIQAIELDCARNGVVIYETTNKVKKYLHVRGKIVGVCRGEETEYVFAECTSGFYHGWPASIGALRDMGANL